MTGPVVSRVHARRVWDSRGRPTVEVEIHASDGSIGRSIAPAGASTGSGEALDLRDGGLRLGGYDVSIALENVRREIAPALEGIPVSDQHDADQRLWDLDGTGQAQRLGGNALIATSMALAHTHAAARRAPLWEVFADGRAPLIPVPEVQIFGGGAHADGAIDLQDFMIVPFGASSFAEAMEWTAEVYLAAGAIMTEQHARQGVADEGGYWPAFKSNEQAIETSLEAVERAGFDPYRQIGLSLDIAATQFFRDGKYHLSAERQALSPDAWLETLSVWLDRYPILMIEDPFHEADLERHAELTRNFGHRVQIVADDLAVTDPRRVEDLGKARAATALLCKPNQAGTLTRARAAFDAAEALGWGTIVSARSGETEDTTIAHLSIGWASGQFKVGSFSRSERMAKWNEMLRIEEQLGASAQYAGTRVFPPGSVREVVR